jgi:hypothetical protein
MEYVSISVEKKIKDVWRSPTKTMAQLIRAHAQVTSISTSRSGFHYRPCWLVPPRRAGFFTATAAKPRVVKILLGRNKTMTMLIISVSEALQQELKVN